MLAVPSLFPSASPSDTKFGGRKQNIDADSPDLSKKTYIQSGLCKPVLKGLQETVINALLKDESPHSILHSDGWVLILDGEVSYFLSVLSLSPSSALTGSVPVFRS